MPAVPAPAVLAEPPEVDYAVTEADIAAVWRRLMALARQRELAGTSSASEVLPFHLPGKHDQSTHGRGGGGALADAPGSGSPWDGDKPGGLSEKEMEENGERVMGSFVRKMLIGDRQASPAKVQAAVEAAGKRQVKMRTWRDPFSPDAPWGGDGSTQMSVAVIASALRPTHSGSVGRLKHIVAEEAVVSSVSAKVKGGATLSEAEKRAGMQNGVYLRDGIYPSGSGGAAFSLVFPRSVLNAKGTAAMPQDAVAYTFRPGKQGIAGHLYPTQARAGATDVVRAVNISHMASAKGNMSEGGQDYIVPRRIPLRRAEAILVNTRRWNPAELAQYKQTFARRFPGMRWIAQPEYVNHLYDQYVSAHLTGQLGKVGKRTKAQETLGAEEIQPAIFHLPGGHDQFTHAGAKGAAEREDWVARTKGARNAQDVALVLNVASAVPAAHRGIITEVKFTDTAEADRWFSKDREVNAWYGQGNISLVKERLDVQSHRAKDILAHEFGHAAWDVEMAAGTKRRQLQLRMEVERLHDQAVRNWETVSWAHRTAGKKGPVTGNPGIISGYAATGGAREHLAEAYSAYIMRPGLLKRRELAMYAWMKRNFFKGKEFTS